MFTKIMIALIAFLVVASVASAQEWQPSWAHDPIPLVQGQEYKTGSPLSQPGLGLFGGIANALTGGALPQFTGGGSICLAGTDGDLSRHRDQRRLYADTKLGRGSKYP